MDLSGVHNLQFLDLSEVDEGEKIAVLSSLRPNKPDNKLPWFIGHEKSTLAKASQKSSKPESSQNKTVSYGGPHNTSAPVPQLQHAFPSNQYFPEPVSYPSIPYQPPPPPSSKSIPIIDPSTGRQVIYNNYTPGSNLPQRSPVYYPPGSVAVTVLTTNVYPQPTAIYNPTFYPSVNQYTFPQVVPPFNTDTTNAYVTKPVNGVGIHDPIIDNTNFGPPVVSANVFAGNDVASNFPSTNSGTPAWVSSAAPSSTETATPVWIQNNSAQGGPVVAASGAASNFVPSGTGVNNAQIGGTVTHTESTVKNGMNELQDNALVTSQVSTAVTQPTNVNSTGPSTGTVVKSWAGLFNSKKDKTEDDKVLNGVKTAFNTEAVNKESNNNDINGTVCPIKNPRKAQFVDPDCYRMGEFLTSFALDGRAISLQPRGLINQSNYCYINSILQALIACPPVYNLLNGLSQNISSNEKRKPTPVIDGMCRFIKEFKHLPASMRVSRRSDPKGQQKKDQTVIINTDIPFEPSWIYKMLNGIRTDLMEGRQEDAEEFLGCLLNNLNDEMLELIKLVKNDTTEEESQTNTGQDIEDMEEKGWQTMGPKNKGSVTRRTELERTPISDIFGGSLRSRILRAGDQVTENIQPFFTLQLNIEKVKTVKEALETLTTKYQLEGLTSSKTNEEVEAWQQVMLDELPVILVLHLKCFDFKLDGCTKIIKALEFPVDLKIDPKLLSSRITASKEKQYKLFAVVYHDGKEASKGHYLTDAFHVGYSSWLRYDDASVKPVQEEHVLKPLGTRVPYLLFYRRSDTIRSK